MYNDQRQTRLKLWWLSINSNLNFYSFTRSSQYVYMYGTVLYTSVLFEAKKGRASTAQRNRAHRHDIVRSSEEMSACCSALFLS